MVYTLRFFFTSKFSLFHNSNIFGSCFIHILYTGVLKLKKNSGAKRLTFVLPDTVHTLGSHRVYVRRIHLVKMLF